MKHPGTVLRAHLKSKTLTPLGDGKPIASIDGIVKAGDDYFATDWPGGRLLRIAKRGEAREVLAGFYQLADLGYGPTGHTLAMPVMSDNRLLFLRLGAMP